MSLPTIGEVTPEQDAILRRTLYLRVTGWEAGAITGALEFAAAQAPERAHEFHTVNAKIFEQADAQWCRMRVLGNRYRKD